uniref:Uncharacterized protein n=1 Tax=Rhizophora mucronata TaxID=61149 RepID=A0A2P2QC64_RHIMU
MVNFTNNIRKLIHIWNFMERTFCVSEWLLWAETPF